MVNPTDIKKTYAAMSDAQLHQFAMDEGSTLTKDAFHILKTEFQSRRISSDIITRIEDGSYVAESANVKRIIKAVPDQLSITALNMALNEKRDGKTDDDIIYHLMEHGLEEDQARLLVDQLKPEATLLLKKANATMLTSIFIVLAGLAIKLISPNKSFVTFLDIASTCTLIFGVFRFLKGYFDYNKFRTVLNHLGV